MDYFKIEIAKRKKKKIVKNYLKKRLTWADPHDNIQDLVRMTKKWYKSEFKGKKKMLNFCDIDK